MKTLGKDELCVNSLLVFVVLLEMNSHSYMYMLPLSLFTVCVCVCACSLLQLSQCRSGIEGWDRTKGAGLHDCGDVGSYPRQAGHCV